MSKISMSARNFGDEFYCYGVYSIYCHVNGFVYYGSAASLGGIAKRVNRHIRELEQGIHKNPVLQRDWRRYGVNGFVFTVMETCEPGDCLQKEQAWIDSRGVGEKNLCYNVCPIAGNTLGTNLSLEHRQKIGDRFRGKPKSEEQRQKISFAQKGKPRPYARAKKGIPKKDPSKCATYGFQGKKHTEETKKKIGLGNQGKKLTTEHIEKMRQCQLKLIESSSEARERLATIAKKGAAASRKKMVCTYVATSPDGSQILLTGLNAFCQKHGLSQSKMSSIVSGQRNSHKGWQCRLATQEDISSWEGQRWSYEAILDSVEQGTLAAVIDNCPCPLPLTSIN